MKNKLLVLVSILLVSIMLFTLVGCKDPGEGEPTDYDISYDSDDDDWNSGWWRDENVKKMVIRQYGDTIEELLLDKLKKGGYTYVSCAWLAPR